MKMTQKLANDLMDCLAAVAISAMGGIIIKDGEPYVPDEVVEKSQAYARATFLEIIGAWEEATGEPWDVVENT